MAIAQYSILKGHPSTGKVVSGASAHFQVTLDALDATKRSFVAAVNIESVDGSEILYATRPAFTPPSVAALGRLPAGITGVPSMPEGLALDFVRQTIAGQPMITREAMHLLPVPATGHSFTTAPGPTGHSTAHALQNAVATLVDQAIAAPDSLLYFFGSAYADGGVVDGIHDIHMNQGNPITNHGSENGTWQDGAVFAHFPSQNTWTALFLAFQTESWHTDAAGNPVS